MRRLFPIGGARPRHPAVERWLDGHPGALGEIARYWLDVIRACGSDVHDLLHDGHPTACVGGVAFAYVALFRAHVNVGFFAGAELPDPAGLLRGSGRFMRHVKVTLEDDGDEAALVELVQSAYADVKQAIASSADGDT